MSIKQMTKISLFTAMMVVFTIVVPAIPLPIIQTPFTLQTLIIMICAVLLKPKEAFLSIFIYVLLGAIGIPVFSGFTGEIGVILGPKGGFILTFPVAAFLISYFKGNKSFIRMFIVNVLFGIILVYLFGILSLSIHLKQSYLTMAYGMLGLGLIDLVKAALASYIGTILKEVKYLNE